MTRHNTLQLVAILAVASCLMCCRAKPSASPDAQPWHVAATADTPPPGQQVTVVIALSSIVPGGIVGHAGLAVEDQYWDFGPKRGKLFQPLKSIRSEAGPWWDDPDQRWTDDRSLNEVLADMPDKVHPLGSLVAVFQVQVTDEQAQAITAFWQDTYERMRQGEDTYRLTARQCASMVAWSLHVGMEEAQATKRLPDDLRLMSPTTLYETLADNLAHTAGPDLGQPADVTHWQLKQDGFALWQRPAPYDELELPQFPRTRLAIERIKHLPIDLLTR